MLICFTYVLFNIILLFYEKCSIKFYGNEQRVIFYKTMCLKNNEITLFRRFFYYKVCSCYRICVAFHLLSQISCLKCFCLTWEIKNCDHTLRYVCRGIVKFQLQAYILTPCGALVCPWNHLILITMGHICIRNII